MILSTGWRKVRMMKIFYSILIIGIITTSFCYADNLLKISERTREELYITIDETVNPDDFKPYDLYKVYENMITSDETKN